MGVSLLDTTLQLSKRSLISTLTLRSCPDARMKVYDYTQLIEGRDYVLEAANKEVGSEEFYMTGYGKGIKPQDKIVLRGAVEPIQYLVKKIDYYYDPSDAWIALLVQC
jgi:hypothetical protein